ncbi:hypothetical protein EDD15DRAFT_2259940 [Pisolithus albus]|nr:hypothetical protein EDD15DRAFT_2259940 [Pisolithus albus]
MGRLSHVTEWPAMFKEWTTGSFRQISNSKLGNLHPASGARFIQCCLPHIRSRWEPVSQSTSIAVSELVSECWLMFSSPDLKVTHSQFIGVLDAWLTQYEAVLLNFRCVVIHHATPHDVHACHFLVLLDVRPMFQQEFCLLLSKFSARLIDHSTVR